MDAIVKKLKPEKPGRRITAVTPVNRPTREQAEAAIHTLILWAGDDPDREGLQDTPKRVAKAYRELFSGYEECPLDVLNKTFEEVGGYDDLVMLRSIEFTSHCEHHMVPIIGKAHIAYMPNGRVVGISKIARVVEILARRLQTQETMTAEIADAIDEGLNTRGVAVLVEAEHHCMSMRGVCKKGVITITTQLRGCFQEDERLERRFLNFAGQNPSA